MAEFVDDLADFVISGGIGGRYGTPSGSVSVQVNMRRDQTGAATVALFQQAGGVSFPLVQKEQQGVQVLVDSTTISGARDTARSIYNLLHDQHALCIGTHEVLWLRAVAPPQAIPTGPTDQRFQFSVNFDALLVLQ